MLYAINYRNDDEWNHIIVDCHIDHIDAFIDEEWDEYEVLEVNIN